MSPTFNPLAIILSQNKLTGPSYVEWNRNLDIVLTSEGYKFVLTQSCPDLPGASASPEELAAYERWTKINEMTRCYILASIDGVLQQQHLSMLIARDMMLNLKKMFDEQGRSARQDVMRNLLNTKIVEGTPVREYALKMIGFLNELKILAERQERDEEEQGQTLTKGEAKPREVQIRDVPMGKYFHCGKDGHWKRNCPIFIANKKQVPLTPKELWSERKPSLQHIRIWGCPAYVKKGNANKLEARLEVCLFVRYPKGTKAPEVVPDTSVLNPIQTLEPQHSGRTVRQPDKLMFLGETYEGIQEEQDPNTYKEAHADINDEPCVYKKANKNVVVFLVLYVDDILLIGNGVGALSAVKAWFSHNFDMKDLGEASYILGIKLMRDRKNRMLGLSQAAYIDNLLVKFAMHNSKKDRDSKKSTSGYVLTLGDGAISWRSVKQSCIVDSTMEAEYIAACEIAKEVVWLKTFLLELGVVPLAKGPIIFHCDNSASIAQSKDPRGHKKGKHIERKYHLIRETAQ
ncbi:hypothetical protein Acr_07g0013440 [Actinidia rufa]|uniref:CCHC-type domain-containing protein n=1 Tax=Actinidia rufa TaxID=165716 RepID=A0A7J0EXK7_9ERIC|nr:hypothetical protein Acr_07g0013440 [Actinidia rufa]